MEMNKPELVSEERKNESRLGSWMRILKIAIIIIIAILFLLLIKDYLMPKEEVSLGLASPSIAEFTVIRGIETR